MSNKAKLLGLLIIPVLIGLYIASNKGTAENIVPADTSNGQVTANDKHGVIPKGYVPYKPEPQLSPSSTKPLTTTVDLAKGKKVKPDPLKRVVPAPPLSDRLHREAAYLVKNGRGKVHPVDLDNNPNSQKFSAVEAVASPNQFPERVSMAVMKKLDKQRFRSDKVFAQEYMDVAEPGRIYDLATPDKGIKRLKRTTPYFTETTIDQGPVTISMEGEPDSPMNLTALGGGGKFDNGLTYTTVMTDSSGNCTVTFIPTRKVEYKLLAGSPFSAGMLKYVVRVGVSDKELSQNNN